MALKFYKLYKIDRDNDAAVEENFENLSNIENYVAQVIEKHRSKYEREYRFIDGEETAKNNVIRILKEEALDSSCQTMANRLLEKERIANERIRHMGHEIPTSMFIVVQDDITETESQLFFIKADYDEYIMEDREMKVRDFLKIEKSSNLVCSLFTKRMTLLIFIKSCLMMKIVALLRQPIGIESFLICRN